MACLDTDIIIDYLKNDKKVVDKIRELRLEGEELSTTSINSFELFRGNVNLGNKSDREAVDIFLSNVILHDFDLESSKKAAEIFESLKKEGNLIELPDIMIASIALANNETLITGNLKHFQRINGLSVKSI